jgi:hypothetical protein
MSISWGNVVSTISGAAPILGSLFGPAGTAVGVVAGAGLKLVATALGCDATQDAVSAAIATDPNAALKLKEFEMVHKLELEKLAVLQIGMELADVANARSRQIEHEKITGKSDINLYVLAWLFIVGFFGTMITMFIATMTGAFKPDTPQIAIMLLTSVIQCLTLGVGVVLQYFFGSSKSSKDKNEMIFNSAPIKE